jgi:hypothetical protein
VIAVEIHVREDVFDFGKCRAAVRERGTRVTAEVAHLRTEGEGIAEDQLARLLARAELEQTIGRTPGQ